MTTYPHVGAVAGGSLATVTPLHPKTQSITFSLDSIRQLEGLYCLNDLHKMAGGHKRQSPYYYMKSPQGKAMLAIYENGQDYAPPNSGSYICLIKGKGKNQGTYADLAIALDYASWIDKRFFVLLSQYVKRVVNGQSQPQSLTDDVNQATRLLNQADNCTSIAGRVLCVIGRYKKPLIKQYLTNLLDNQQLKIEGI